MSTRACERVTFNDIAAVVGASGTPLATSSDIKMSLFQPNCCMKICISPCFSTTVNQTGPLNACHNTTQQALSAHLCCIVSTLSIPDLDEKHINRVFSPGRGETRLKSCVCEVHEGGYSTDNSSASRACCIVSIGKERRSLVQGIFVRGCRRLYGASWDKLIKSVSI